MKGSETPVPQTLEHMNNTNLQFEIREVVAWASESGEAYPNMSDGEVLDEVIQRLEILANLPLSPKTENT